MKKYSLLAATLALTFALSACGGSDDGKDGGATGAVAPPTTAQPSDLNGGGSGGGGGATVDPDSLPAAQKKIYQSLVKVVECMRTKGYTMDDPKPGDIAAAPKNPPNAAKANSDSAECVQKANTGG